MGMAAGKEDSQDMGEEGQMEAAKAAYDIFI